MSRRLAGFDRLIVFLVGAVALALGAWALLWAFEVPIAHELAERIDPVTLQSALDSQWYPLVLIAVCILAAVLGLWLLAANLRRHTFNQVVSPSGGEEGRISIATSRLAGTIGELLQRNPDVLSVHTALREDRGRPTVTWTVNAKPTLRMPQLVDEIEEAESDLRTALPGVDLDTRYLIQLRPVDAM